VPRYRLALAGMITLLTLLGSTAQAGRSAAGKPAVVQTTISASPAEVHAALLEALSDWKMRKTSQEEGIVKTEWVERHAGDQVYQGRIIAEYAPSGYQVLLTVKHEKQLKLQGLQASLGGPSPGWMDVDGDWEIARAVVTSVEESFGLKEMPVELGKKDPTAGRPIEVWDCIVSPSTAARILDLKSKRRDLVTEVKAMDQKILDAVYADKVAEIQGEMAALKARKVAMEDEITSIDREILSLVVAE